MTCGLGLGILVVFFLQAEHVCCLWTEGAQSFQSSNTYVGLPPPDGSLFTSGSYPQDQVRQGFISPLWLQSRSFNPGPAVPSGSGPAVPSGSGPAVPSGSGPGLSTRSSPQVSQSSVRLVKSRASKANRQRLFSPRADAPIGARQFGLSSAVAGGPQNQNPSISRRNWSALWGTQRPVKYPNLSPRQMFSSRPVPAPRQSSRSAAKIHFSEVGSSSRFNPDAPGQRGRSVPMQTNARGPAKRVFSKRRSEGQKARRFSPHTQAWKPAVGQGGSRATNWLQTHKTSYDLPVPRSSTVGAPQGFALATVYKIPANFGGFAIRRL